MKTTEDLLHELSNPGLTWQRKKAIVESYAKEHAVEFMIHAQGLMFSPENSPPINEIYDKWKDKTMKQILHIFDDGVYAGPEKPEEEDYLLGMAGIDNYKLKFKEWQSACVKVEGAYRSERIINRYLTKGWFLDIGFGYYLVKSGQLCETKIEDGKKIVTKIY